jgi:hypothetical protein
MSLNKVSEMHLVSETRTAVPLHRYYCKLNFLYRSQNIRAGFASFLFSAAASKYGTLQPVFFAVLYSYRYQGTGDVYSCDLPHLLKT